MLQFYIFPHLITGCFILWMWIIAGLVIPTCSSPLPWLSSKLRLILNVDSLLLPVTEFFYIVQKNISFSLTVLSFYVSLNCACALCATSALCELSILCYFNHMLSASHELQFFTFVSGWVCKTVFPLSSSCVVVNMYPLFTTLLLHIFIPVIASFSVLDIINLFVFVNLFHKRVIFLTPVPHCTKITSLIVKKHDLHCIMSSLNSK